MTSDIHMYVCMTSFESVFLTFRKKKNNISTVVLVSMAKLVYIALEHPKYIKFYNIFLFALEGKLEKMAHSKFNHCYFRCIFLNEHISNNSHHTIHKH